MDFSRIDDTIIRDGALCKIMDMASRAGDLVGARGGRKIAEVCNVA